MDSRQMPTEDLNFYQNVDKFSKARKRISNLRKASVSEAP
jgi:hypothetical protein